MATYKLTVGDVADIQLNVTSDSVTTKFSSTGNSEFYVSMLSLTYTKKIFAPSEIHTVLSITAKTSGTTSFPAFSDLHKVFSKKIVTLKDDDTTVAENFFVYKMKPSHGKVSSSSAAMKVELFIFSLDKLLTIDKYCNAFTAKKLGGEIFTSELNKFRLEGTAINGAVNLQFLNYTSKVEMETVDGKEQGKTVEIRQPYLVQYNESFYDFLARSASRCGEMLYFEGGHLNLGMKPNTDTATTDQTSVADSVDFEDSLESVLTVSDRHYNFINRGEDNDNRYVDSVYQFLGAVTEEPTEKTSNTKDNDENITSKTTTTTTTYSKGQKVEEEKYTYYTSKDAAPENQLAGEPKQKVTTITLSSNDANKTVLHRQTITVDYNYELENGKYKKKGRKFVYTTKSTTVDEGEKFSGIYNLPEPNDAVFEELKKNGYTSYLDEWIDYRTFLFDDLFLNLLDSTTLYDAVADLGEGFIWGTVEAALTMNRKNNTNNTKNLTLTKAENPDQTDNEVFNLFSTLKANMTPSSFNVNKTSSIVSLLVADFYSKIRLASKNVSKLLVRLNYGATDKGFCLGDVLKVGSGKDDFYVVTKVERTQDGQYVVEAIPPFYKEVSETTQSNVTTYTITTFIPCPPLLPDIPTIKTSEPQVAFVENNLDPNKLGRVRVKFPWQSKEDDSSPWIRMATPFATNGGGVTFKPENGDEVLLNFEEGNIERPYIVGSLQSKYVTDHWGSLSDRVIQSKNGHSITFTDKDDGLDFLIGSSAPQLAPLVTFIKSLVPNAQPLIDFQNMVDLTGGIKISDRYGLYSINMSSDGRVVDIKSPLGNVNLSAFTGINISAPNGNINIKGKNVTIAAGNKLTLESGSAVSDRWINKKTFKSKEGFKSAVGEITTDLVDRTVGKLIDLSFIRTVVEVFTRPIDGTLKIKSNTFVLIEAGKGSAQVPEEDFNKVDYEKARGHISALHHTQEVYLNNINNAIDKLTAKANALCGAIKTAFETTKTETDRYKTTKVNGVDCYALLTKMKEDEIIQKVFAKRNDANFNIDTVIPENDFDFDNTIGLQFKIGDKLFAAPKQENNETNTAYKARVKKLRIQYIQDRKYDVNTVIPGRAALVAGARKLGAQAKALFDAVDKWTKFDFDANNGERDGMYYSDALMTTVRGLDIFGDFIDKTNKGTVDLTKDITTTYDQELSKLRRAMAYELIMEVKDKDGYKEMFSVDSTATKPDFGDDAAWDEFAEKIDEPKGLNPISNYFRKNWLSDWQDATVNRKKWKATANGKILFSDLPGKTLYLNGDQLGANENVAGTVTTAHPLALKKKVNSVK